MLVDVARDRAIGSRPRICRSVSELPAPPPGKTGWPWTAESTQCPDTTPDGHAWPRVSVVTPSYNQGQFLEAAIRSVLLQNYPNLELIIIDGGSTDESQRILDKYRPWLTHAVSEPDDGQYAAINKGFAFATGSVMSWLNSDDLFAMNSFWAVGGIFADLGSIVDWITGIPAMLDREGNLGLVLPRAKLNRQLLRLAAYDGVTLNFIQQEGTFWTRALWARAGAALDSSLALAADYELWCRLADHAELYGVSALLAGFRRHGQQKTAHSMLAYMHEMAACRRARSWGFTERQPLARFIRRRLARLIYRLCRPRNLVVYNPDDMRWEIVGA